MRRRRTPKDPESTKPRRNFVDSDEPLIEDYSGYSEDAPTKRYDAHRIEGEDPEHPGYMFDGAPISISHRKQGALFQMLREGNYISTSLRALGIQSGVHQLWMSKGGDPYTTAKTKVPVEFAVEPYRSYAANVRISEAIGEQTAVQDIRVAMQTDWKAAAWFLARKHPKRWSEKREKESAANSSSGQVTLYVPDNERERKAAVQEGFDPDNDLSDLDPVMEGINDDV